MFEGAGVGAGVSHCPFSKHDLLMQSLATLHFLPVPQRGQKEPPQSMSVSSPPMALSLQLPLVGFLVGVGVGSMVGSEVG